MPQSTALLMLPARCLMPSGTRLNPQPWQDGERVCLKLINYHLKNSGNKWKRWNAKLKRAHATWNIVPVEATSGTKTRSSLNSSKSNNVTGAVVALNTKLHAQQHQQVAANVEIALPFPATSQCARAQ
ncbi:uncharacterized protein UTRI_01993 [Ustilago trichophora]|uniref:Uncharacterized protein n=1 Tax=Ustilago trichophora TaxID=86804 RepID=A0A5C3DYT3_9BASI|nr:uncharacterized protein UTRI_01993 [Ustilago trichophora]